MRRITVVGIIALSLVAMPLIVAAAPGGDAKVNVCHIPDDGGEPHTITISQKALDAHISHGDLAGTCEDIVGDADETNYPPVASAVINNSAECIANLFGSACGIVADGTASSDPNGDALTYSWIVTGGTGVTLISSVPIYSFIVAPGDYTITLVVSDGTLSDTTTNWFTAG